MPRGVYKRKSLEERFWFKVDKSEDVDACWPWTATRVKSNGRDEFRYGMFHFEGKMQYAHRASWVLANGPVPDGMCVLHKCDNPLCVNPEHLFLGTQRDNIKDMDTKGRRGACSGESHPHAELTWDDVREIRRRCAAEKGIQARVGREYGIGKSHVSQIVLGKLWKEDAA